MEGVLKEPLLYLSLYLKLHRARYYELLQTVRTDGDWEAWMSFFATGVSTTAEDAAKTARSLTGLFREDQRRIRGVGRGADSALRIHESLERRAIATIGSLAAVTKLSVPTVTKAINSLRRLGMVREVTKKKRGRVFVYSAYLRLLNAGMGSS